jgi:hypothetical protein
MGPKNQLILDRNKPIMERLAALEDLVSSLKERQGQIIKSTQEVVNKLQFINSKTAEVVEAVISALGTDFAAKVEQAAKANKVSRDEKVATLQKAQVTEALAAGKLKIVETVSEQTLIVGKELKNNEVSPPGYHQITFSEVDNTIKAQLLGKKVGDQVKALNDVTFEITELYESVASEDVAS